MQLMRAKASDGRPARRGIAVAGELGGAVSGRTVPVSIEITRSRCGRRAPPVVTSDFPSKPRE
jgi:hypothetical protein